MTFAYTCACFQCYDTEPVCLLCSVQKSFITLSVYSSQFVSAGFVHWVCTPAYTHAGAHTSMHPCKCAHTPTHILQAPLLTHPPGHLPTLNPTCDLLSGQPIASAFGITADEDADPDFGGQCSQRRLASLGRTGFTTAPPGQIEYIQQDSREVGQLHGHHYAAWRALQGRQVFIEGAWDSGELQPALE